MLHAELLQDERGLSHDRQLGRGCREHADLGCLAVHLDSPSAAVWAMSRRYCIPSNQTPPHAAYARSRASGSVDPSPVTARTRPPAVTTLPSRSAVPAWKTTTSSTVPSRPRISAPTLWSPG